MFYDKFVELCNKKGVSRTKACVDCNVSRTAWRKWEEGATPNGTTLNAFADYFGVTRGHLLGAEEDTESLLNDISQCQALLSWVLDNQKVPDEVKYVIQMERPGDSMAALSALSYKAGARFDRGAQKEKPTPVSESGRNMIKIAGRDGSYVEKKLTDEQTSMLRTLIDQLPDADDL